MLKLRNKRRWAKGAMARTLVIYCVRAITLIAIWAVCIKTYAVFKWGATDISDVLIFAATAFGGELLLLAFKRVFAKKNENPDEYS
nr:MAG TPA: hypothetical protein [Bacteriophage sp.]